MRFSRASLANPLELSFVNNIATLNCEIKFMIDTLLQALNLPRGVLAKPIADLMNFDPNAKYATYARAFAQISLLGPIMLKPQLS